MKIMQRRGEQEMKAFSSAPSREIRVGLSSLQEG